MFDINGHCQHIDWNGNKLYGYIDLGCRNTDDRTPITNEVFAIHLACVNVLWKIPVGYFFIKGITSKQIYPLAFQCLQLLSNINIKVYSITYDVASITFNVTSSNFSSFVRFRYNLKDLNQLLTQFTTGSHHVNIFLDSSHMLKLVRNSLNDLDSDWRVISWILFLKNYCNWKKLKI